MGVVVGLLDKTSSLSVLLRELLKGVDVGLRDATSSLCAVFSALVDRHPCSLRKSLIRGFMILALSLIHI